MEGIVHNLESQAETVGLIPATGGAPLDGRVGAVTPAAQRLSRPLGAIDVPHKKVEKICCIGAGYVGMFCPPVLVALDRSGDCGAQLCTPGELATPPPPPGPKGIPDIVC